jgi:hypothetical protein
MNVIEMEESLMMHRMRPGIELSIAGCYFEEWVSKRMSVTPDDGTLDMRALVTKYKEFT